MFGPGPSTAHKPPRGNDAYRTSPSIDDKTAVAEAKDVALERFGKELADMLRELKEKQKAMP